MCVPLCATTQWPDSRQCCTTAAEATTLRRSLFATAVDPSDNIVDIRTCIISTGQCSCTVSIVVTPHVCNAHSCEFRCVLNSASTHAVAACHHSCLGFQACDCWVGLPMTLGSFRQPGWMYQCASDIPGSRLLCHNRLRKIGCFVLAVYCH